MIFENLQKLQARVTPQSIIIGTFRMPRNLYAAPPYRNPNFMQLISTPQIVQKIKSLNFLDGEAWVNAEVEKYIKWIQQKDLEEQNRRRQLAEEQRKAAAEAAAEARQQKQQQDEQLTPRQEKLFKTHTVLVDVNSGDQFLWLNIERRLSEWNVKAWLNAFFQKHRATILSQAPFGLLTFDPTRGTQNQWQGLSEGHTVVFCNTYRPPVWYAENLNPQDYIKRQEKYPQLFQYLLTNLVPYPQEREIILNWLALAVFDRPHSLLSLRGVRGNGKTTLKLIFYHLIGNFVEAQQRVFGDFNAELRNKRCFGIDDNKEIGTRDGHNLRKRLTNPTITLNEKYVQTEVSEKQWASIIVCSNTEDDFYLEYDERKIVSTWLTNKKMEIWPYISEDIFKWLRPFEHPDSTQLTKSHIEFLRQIGEALFTRRLKINISPAFEYRGGHFWEDVIRSLPAFKRYIVEIVQNAEDETPLEYEVLKADYEALNGKNVLNWYRLFGWLESSFNLAGEPLAIAIDKQEKSFVPNLKLQRKRT